MRLLVCSWQVRGNSSSEEIILCVNILYCFILSTTAFRPVRPAIPDQFLTVFPGETVSLECGIQPGRAEELYSVLWLRNNQILNDQTDFSLFVSVGSVSQNGSVYRCTVETTSCSPISTGCSSDPRTVDGNSITLIVGGECTSSLWEYGYRHLKDF